MEKILLPVDGAESADHAVDDVIQQIRNGLHIELHLLNVQLPPAGGPRDTARQTAGSASCLAEGQQKLQSAVHKLESAHIPFQGHVAIGDPVEEIIKCSQQLHCDRIVMGSRQRSGTQGPRAGSVSYRVAHAAGIPVEIVPLHARLGPDP